MIRYSLLVQQVKDWPLSLQQLGSLCGVGSIPGSHAVSKAKIKGGWGDDKKLGEVTEDIE